MIRSTVSVVRLPSSGPSLPAEEDEEAIVPAMFTIEVASGIPQIPSL